MDNLKECIEQVLNKLDISDYDYRYLISEVSLSLLKVCRHLGGASKIELELKALSVRVNKLPVTNVLSSGKRHDNHENELEALKIKSQAIFLFKRILNRE